MTNNFKTLALATASILLLAPQAFATSKVESLSSTGDIKVRNALKIAEVTRPNFGIIEKPSTDVAVSLSTSGATAGTTASFIDNSMARAGEYKISGSSISTINISAVDNGNVPGLSFSAITADYGSNNDLNLKTGAANQPAPTAAGTTLKVGGTLNVASSVTEGDYTPGFTISANYN
jgi:hypothetical protein